MSFLNPLWLWGLSALLIPLAIHLWSKNKSIEIPFGSVQFLDETATRQARKIQLSEKGLLLLRSLMLIFLILLLAEWGWESEQPSENWIILGEEATLPQAYQTNGFKVFTETSLKDQNYVNQWHFLQDLSTLHPEIDSLLWINDFKGHEFWGAIPPLGFHLQLINSGWNAGQELKKPTQDTLNIELNGSSPALQAKLHNILETIELYTNQQLIFTSDSTQVADLSFDQQANQINPYQVIISDTLLVNYQINKAFPFARLYLKKDFILNPLAQHESVNIITEFIAQSHQPLWAISNFDQLQQSLDASYQSSKKAHVRIAGHAPLYIIFVLLLLLVERYISYRKANA